MYIAPKQGKGLWRERGRGRQASESSEGHTCTPLALRCWRRADEGASGANLIALSLIPHGPPYCPAFQLGCNLEKAGRTARERGRGCLASDDSVAECFFPSWAGSGTQHQHDAYRSLPVLSPDATRDAAQYAHCIRAYPRHRCPKPGCHSPMLHDVVVGGAYRCSSSRHLGCSGTTAHGCFVSVSGGACACARRPCDDDAAKPVLGHGASFTHVVVAKHHRPSWSVWPAGPAEPQEEGRSGVEQLPTSESRLPLTPRDFDPSASHGHRTSPLVDSRRRHVHAVVHDGSA